MSQQMPIMQTPQQPPQMPIQQPQTQQQVQNQSQVQQFFPQPQGNIFMINTSQEIANVPVGTGLSAAICLPEGTMYLKTIQNGSPMLLGYRLSSLEGQITNQNSSNNSETSQNQDIVEKMAV